jgi:predicted anti-sigma-YlaC factor YlaD
MIRLLADYLDGTMVTEDRMALDGHLDACPSCYAFLRTYAATIRLTGMVSCDEIPEDLKARLSTLARPTPPADPPASSAKLCVSPPASCR